MPENAVSRGVRTGTWRRGQMVGRTVTGASGRRGCALADDRNGQFTHRGWLARPGVGVGVAEPDNDRCHRRCQKSARDDLVEPRVDPDDLSGTLTIDVESTIVEVHGRGKRGAALGCTKVRGCHPQLTTVAETGQVVFARLRDGSAGVGPRRRVLLGRDHRPVRHAGATEGADRAGGLGVLRCLARGSPRWPTTLAAPWASSPATT